MPYTALESAGTRASELVAGQTVVLRCAEPAVLGEAVRDCVWSLANGRARELVIPAGPYRYAYAAARQILRMANPDEWADNRHPVSRSVIAEGMRKLLRSGVVVGIPRLDRIDSETVTLLASLMRIAELCRRVDAPPQLKIVAGITGEAPTPAMQKLLELGGTRCSDVSAEVAPQSPEIPSSMKVILCVLAAAPHPITLEELATSSGKVADDVQVQLEKWAPAGLVDVGTQIGQGAAFNAIEAGTAEMELGRRLLLERGDLGLPDARLAVVMGGDGALARDLAQKAMDRGEPEVAVRYLRLGGRAATAENREQELMYGYALARTGALDGAFGIFRSHVDYIRNEAESRAAGLLAGALYEGGVLPRTQTEQSLRKAERESRETEPSLALELRATRARLMLKDEEWQRAMTLLRRVSREQLDAVNVRARVRYQLAQALAHSVTGSQRHAERLLEQSRVEANEPQLRAEVARTGLEVSPNSERWTRLAAEHALSELQADELERVIGRRPPSWARDLVDELFTISRSASDTPPYGSSRELYRWLSGKGATALAIWADDDLQVFPAAAAANPGLAAWFDTFIQRMRQYPNAGATPLQGPPNAGSLGGDLLLTAKSWGGRGPLVAIMRRDQMADLHHLLAVLNDD